MKSFFKSLLATIIGILVSFLLVFVIFMAVIGSIVSKQEKEVVIKPNSILYLKLDRPIVDRQPASGFNINKFSKDNRIGLNQLLKSISNAKSDEKIKGIYLETQILGAGFATTKEIRDALLDFRESGKFVVAYSDVYTQSAYYLSTAADKVFFNPAGFFNMNGLRIQTTHLKKTMEKLKVEPTVIKIGSYKGAGEIFEFEKMSEFNREQLERIIDKVWTNIAANISDSRGIPVDTLNHIVENLLIKDPTDVLSYHLVDSLIYKGDVIDYLKKLTDVPDKDDLNAVKLTNYSKVSAPKAYKGIAKDKIALIYAYGDIVNNEGGEDNIGGEKYAREIRKARRDSTIKAIVLRVNSPGGSAMASEAILQEIIKTKGVKPIVVSMGDLAASGGYYIACGADKIIANENTITGSIGVISVFFNTKEFFNNFGVSFDVAKTHKYADFMSGNRPATDVEIDYWRHFTEYTYDQFLTHVSNGRKLAYDDVHEIAQGRVWSGVDALEIGLIDSYGGINDALEAAKELAGLSEKHRVIELPKQVDPLEQLIKEFSGETKIQKVLEPMGLDAKTFNSIKAMIENQGVVARLPYVLDFN